MYHSNKNQLSGIYKSGLLDDCQDCTYLQCSHRGVQTIELFDSDIHSREKSLKEGK